MIYVDVPESSGIDINYLSSPVATLSRYEDSAFDVQVPQWTRITPGIPLELRQSRGNIAKIFAKIALWEENKQSVSYTRPYFLDSLLTLTIYAGSPFCIHASLGSSSCGMILFLRPRSISDF